MAYDYSAIHRTMMDRAVAETIRKQSPFNGRTWSRSNLNDIPVGTPQVKLAKSTLPEDGRGLVVSPPVAIDGNEGVTIGPSQIDPQELRMALLFWDCLEFPNNNVLSFGLDTDGEFLVSERILQRSEVQLSGSDTLGKHYVRAQTAAFQELDAREPGRWSLGRGEKSLSFPDDLLVEGRGLVFELYRAIPIPHRDVALADILAFKQKRQSELLALRHHLERIYQAIEAAPDRPLAKTTELEHLDRALRDHAAASKTTGLKLVLGGLQAKLDLKLMDAIGGAGVALASGGLTGVTDALSLVGVGAAYALGSSVSLKRREKSATPFEYVSMFHRDLF